jgi:hypothetical protein
VLRRRSGRRRRRCGTCRRSCSGRRWRRRRVWRRSCRWRWCCRALRRGRRRRSLMRWRRCGGRRCGMRRRCSRRGPARPCRRLSRLRTLRRLLRSAVGAGLTLLLRDDERRGLCMRCVACKLHHGERSRRKQHNTKSGHEGLVPGITFVTSVRSRADQQISVRPQCGGVQTRIWIYFLCGGAQTYRCSWRIQAFPPNGLFVCSYCGSDCRTRVDHATAVAGFGVVGLFGPRVGNSSGTCPGNSSGLGGSPGSCTGGGASGWGVPGGSSCGGSAGCPGVAGGISGFSIGIYSATLRLSPRSGRLPVTTAAAIFT